MEERKLKLHLNRLITWVDGMLMKLSQHRLVVGGLVSLIIISALVSRGLGCRFGLPYLHHWDEPWIVLHSLHMLQTGDYNPHWFHWSSLLMYLNLIVDISHYLYLMAQPPDVTPFLASMYDIVFTFDFPHPAYPWEISHPSFYLWGRWLTAVMGTGSVAIVYSTAKELEGRWAGIAGAGLLAGYMPHFFYSRFVTTDIPSSFFAVFAVLLTVLYLKRARPSFMVFALIMCGLAASTKYNMAITIIVPSTALILSIFRRQSGYRWWLWVALPCLPVLAFVMGTPYSVLDLPKFLAGFGYTIRNYNVLSEPMIQPGWPHMVYQLTRITRALGSPALIISVLGICFMLWKRDAKHLLILMFFMVYLWMGAGANINYERNFVVLYPLAAIIFACGVSGLYHVLSHIKPSHATLGTIGLILLLVVTTYIVVLKNSQVLARGWKIWTAIETRTETVLRLNDFAETGDQPPPKIGIASELRIHDDDLKKLKAPYAVGQTSTLICYGSDLKVIVVGREHVAYRSGNAEYAQSLNDLIQTLSAHLPPPTTIGGDSKLYLDLFSENPGVAIYVSPEGEMPHLSICEEEIFGLKHVLENERSLLTSGPLVFPYEVPLRAGHYKFYWSARGTKAAGEYPLLEATVLIYSADSDESTELHTETFELTQYADEYELPFQLTQGAKVAVQFKVPNDLFIPERGEDRNVFFGEIGLKSVRDPD